MMAATEFELPGELEDELEQEAAELELLFPRGMTGKMVAPVTTHPRMNPRCTSRMFKVPSTYQEFEARIKTWISTCVTSRTGGAHREQRLVTGNQSLKGIWDKILRYRVGQEVPILAEYIWGPNRVESVIFSTSAPPPPPPPSPPTTLVWPTEPLPPSELHRFEKAITVLEIKAISTQDPRKRRYLCWIEKLKKPDIDDRVITWCRICPKYSPFRLLIGSCDLTQCTSVEQTALERSIQSVSDVEIANKVLRFITYMRSSIVFDFEMTAPNLQLENLRIVTDEVGRAIDNLDKLADPGLGGGSAMLPAYRAIKDWIKARQNDPKSLYSCF